MNIGGVRHVADIRADDMDKTGAGVIGLQMGSNKGASQKGMAMGASRHVADMKVESIPTALFYPINRSLNPVTRFCTSKVQDFKP